MRRYGGTVIFQGMDDDGLIEVVEEGVTRSLHFGSSAKQSTLDISRPEQLQLAYTAAMMSALLFQPAPANIALIGLGGGSLLHFLRHHYPDSEIDVVEKRSDVIAAAKRFFQLPDDDKLNIYLGDGSDFIRNCRASYDLLLVDAYHDDGMDDATDGTHFFQQCHQALSEQGVMSINLWSSHASRLEQSLLAIRECFNGHCLRLPVKGRGNIIALAYRNPQTGNLRTARQRAAVMEQQLELPFGIFLRDLRRHNLSLFSRLFS
ncbi:hypothetical protein BOW53_14750 [Solemya pervernicosa gill symbiont]|uniref:PABS domain-containing protein n=2 Tax=Gammaproteobacteria incertae sedis TaxID=118884 RepID=A0A1T2L0X3_9GAMM|nr:hypothetical protein BOW53_14750 [Solemya pervernicosa gill symbiont]